MGNNISTSDRLVTDVDQLVMNDISNLVTINNNLLPDFPQVIPFYSAPVELIVDILTDPVTFTNTSSISEAFEQVITKILKPNPESISAFQQFIKIYSAALESRSNYAYQYEEYRRNVIAQRFQTSQRALLVQYTTKNTLNTPYRIDSNLDKAVTNAYSIATTELRKCNLYDVAMYLIKEKLNKNPSFIDLIAVVDLAFGLRTSLVRIHALPMLIQQVVDYEKEYADLKLDTSTIGNSSFFEGYLGNINVIGSIDIPTTQYTSRLSEVAIWNDNIILQDGDKLKLFSIRNNGPDKLEVMYQFSCRNIHSILIECIQSMLVSNDHLIVIMRDYNSKLDGWFVLSLPSGKRIKATIPNNFLKLYNKSGKWVVSDTKYLYTFDKTQIRVWEFVKDTLVQVRIIPIRLMMIEGCTPITKDEFKKVLKDFRTEVYTDGTILYFLIAKYHKRIQISLADGAIIGVRDPRIYRNEEETMVRSIRINPIAKFGVELIDKKTLQVFLVSTPAPLWLTGVAAPDIDLDKAIARSKFSKAYGVAELAIVRDLWVITHIAGLNFGSFKVPLESSFDFEFSNLGLEDFDIICDSIEKLVEITKVQKRSKEWSPKMNYMAIQSVLLCLGLRIQNFMPKEEMENIPPRVVKVLKNLLMDPKMDQIKQTIIFVFLSGLKWLWKSSPDDAMDFCPIIFALKDKYMLHFAIEKFCDEEFYPNIFSIPNLKKYLGYYIRELGNGTASPDIKLFVTTFMGSIFYHVQRALTNQLESPTFEIFAEFSKVLIDTAISSPELHGDIKELLRQYLGLVRPIIKYSFVSKVISDLLLPLYHAVSNYNQQHVTIAAENIKKEDLPYTYQLLVEVFIIYTEVIKNLLEGGEEIKFAKEYSWLIASCLKTDLNPSKIDAMVPAIFFGEKSMDDLMKKGLSFNANARKVSTFEFDENAVKDDINTFLMELICTKETDRVKKLMDYLYRKCPNIMNKKLTTEDRHIERLTLSVFIKQLGLGSIVMDLVNDLMSEKQPMIHVYIKPVMEVLYRVRRNLKAVKQSSNTVQVQTHNQVGAQTQNIDQNYDLFLDAFMKKCVFLIHIEPAIRFDITENESLFHDCMKNICNFICAPTTLHQIYALMEKASKARLSVTNGIALLSDILISNTFPTGTMYVINMIINRDTFSSYVDTIPASGKFNNAALEAVISNLVDVTKSINAERVTRFNAIMGVMNILRTVVKIDVDYFINTMKNILQMFNPDQERKGSLAPFISIVISFLYIICKDNENYIKDPKFVELFQIISDFNAPLPVMLMCEQILGKTLINIDHIKNVFMSGDPALYHVASIMFGKLITSEQDKFKILHIIFGRIGDIASGQPKLWLREQPLLHDEAQFDAKIVRTSGILLTGCLEFIHIIRTFLTSNNDMSELVRSVMKYILDINSPSLERRNKAMEMKEYESFNTPNMLFAVFAILTNIIESTRKFSLIKDTTTNTIYYMVHFDAAKSFYYAYKVPFDSNMSLVLVPYGPNVVPLSLMPFKYEMFTEYDCLIPHFASHLSFTQSSITMECLSYYVLQSLDIYMSSNEFVEKFIKLLASIDIPAITYANDNIMFKKLLKHHLQQQTEGFMKLPDQKIQFYYASPADVINPRRYQITENSLSCNKGVHMFITQTLPFFAPTMLKVQFFEIDNPVRIGALELTAEDLDGEHAFVEITYESIFFNAEERIEIDYINNISILWDPFTQIITFFNDIKKASIASHRMKSKAFSFFIMAYGETRLTYELLHPTDAACNTIFRDKIRIDNDDVPKPFYLRILDKKKENPNKELLRFDVSALKGSYKAFCDLKNLKPPEVQPYEPESIHYIADTSSFGATLLCTQAGECVIDTITSENDAAAVDDNTGLRTPVSPGTIFKPKLDVDYINPMGWGVLPTDIINRFACGYTAKQRISTVNNMFISMVTNKLIPFEKIMKVFNLDIRGLLDQVLHLLLFNEKIVPSCIVDYTVNFMDKSTPPQRAILQVYKTALHNILDGIIEMGKVEEFANLWFTEVVSRFKNIYFHSAIDGHPSAIQLHSDKYLVGRRYNRDGITAWLALDPSMIKRQNPGILIRPDENPPNNKFIFNNVEIIKKSNIEIFGRNVDSYAVLIPFSKYSNESLFGTFVDLAVSFKYLVYYLADNTDKIPANKISNWRSSLYNCVFDSFIADSPYFNTFKENVCQFIRQIFPICVTDISGGLIQRINFVSSFVLSTRSAGNSTLSSLIEDIKVMQTELALVGLKQNFPEFCSEFQRSTFKDLEVPPISIQMKFIPFELTTDNCPSIVKYIQRLLMPRTNIENYPFYLLLDFWAVMSMRAPSVDYKVLEDGKILQVHFKNYVPQKFHFTFVGDNSKSYKGKYYISTSAGGKNLEFSRDIETFCHRDFFVTLDNDTKWTSLEYIVESDEQYDVCSFLKYFRDNFVSDMRMINTMWNNSLDRAIIKCFPSTTYTDKTLNLNFIPSLLVSPKLAGYPFSMLYVRAVPLLIVNWLQANNMINTDTDSSMSFLSPFISSALKMSRFIAFVKKVGNENRPELTINRRAGLDVREGHGSKSNSIIAQVSNLIKNPKQMQSLLDKPWKITFTGEMGIDMGGLARELVTECANDLSCPNVGVFCQTPNGQSQVGYYKDRFIPVPSSDLPNQDKIYRIVGALIGMTIRTGLVQEFMFPPVFWNFLVKEKISIQDIYDIDVNYKNTMESIKDAIQSNISAEEFSKQFNMKFVVRNSFGQEISLTQRGRTEPVTLSNAQVYIAMANEFRINELKKPLIMIRDGFLENIGLLLPAFLDSETLEFSACGDSEISYEDMHKIINFVGISDDQQSIFLQVVQKFSPEQRAALLKFSTGRARLPPAGAANMFKFVVDNDGALVDMLPTSSTCFHKLHLPRYSSFEKAFQMISIAVEMSGSFERA